MIEFGGHWDSFLPLAEFSYNNNYHSSIDMAPFEAFMVGDVGLPFVGLMRSRSDLGVLIS